MAGFVQVFLLLLTTMIWGFGFIATRWTLELFDPMWANSLRYSLAGLIALPFLIYRGSFKRPRRRHGAAILAGLFLFTSMYLQVHGLLYTSIAKSGFITTFYVFFTPILGIIFFKERYTWVLWGCISLALAGVALMGDLSLSGLNLGDLMTLGCALLGAGHIVVIGRVAAKIVDPIEFNFMQCFFMGVLGPPMAYLIEGAPPLNELGGWSDIMAPTPLGGLFFLAIFSSLLAFTMQVVAQKRIPAHLVSMIFLLESLFATLFGWLILSERLSTMNIVGAAIVLAAVMATPLIEYEKGRRRRRLLR